MGTRCLLEPSDPDDLLDLVCIGFGPASLAIAIALQDALSSGSPSLSPSKPRVAFLERQNGFSWHAGMLLPGAKMQITFIKDLATLRNPRSEFTFLNYLHQKDRLVQFANLSTFLPLRVEYEDYMRWCASHFDPVVTYNREVLDVSRSSPAALDGRIDSFIVRARDTLTKEIDTRRARHVIIAVGGRPTIPKHLPQTNPRVFHSALYTTTVSGLFKDRNAAYDFAVIGAGQSAAEIFDNLGSTYPKARVRLLIRGAALKPSDDSPFVNEIFDPTQVDDVYGRDPDVRTSALAGNRSTNYSVVRPELLEHIYAKLYVQRLKTPNEDEWQHRILPHRSVIYASPVTNSPNTNKGPSRRARSASTASLPKPPPTPDTSDSDAELDNDAEPSRLRLQIENRAGDFKVGGHNRTDEMDVDALIVATGYEHDGHIDILKSVEDLKAGNDWPVVARNYRVRLDRSKVVESAGIWLQGCNEATHGLSDTLLSILAARAGEMVQSLFGSDESTKVRDSG